MTNKVFEMKIKIDRSAFDLTKEKVVLKWRRCNETNIEGSMKMDIEDSIIILYYIVIITGVHAGWDACTIFYLKGVF